MNRGDLSSKLIHLTRGGNPDEERERFINIYNTQKLNGNNNDIRGGFKCVCFSEAPISELALVLSLARTMRYAPFGVIVDKSYVYNLGGRPAIYQSNDEYDLLHESQKYRHVRYEPQRE